MTLSPLRGDVQKKVVLLAEHSDKGGGQHPSTNVFPKSTFSIDSLTFKTEDIFLLLKNPVLSQILKGKCEHMEHMRVSGSVFRFQPKKDGSHKHAFHQKLIIVARSKNWKK